MTNKRLELPQGTLDLLILKAVALEPLHGWAISEPLQQISGDAVHVKQGRCTRPCTAWNVMGG